MAILTQKQKKWVKVNPPNSHPSNPIHKAATAESAKAPVAKHPPEQLAAQTDTKPATQPPETEPTAGHNLNKIALTVGAVGLAGLAWLMR